MKKRIVRLTALILTMAMSMSLLCSNAWARESVSERVEDGSSFQAPPDVRSSDTEASSDSQGEENEAEDEASSVDGDGETTDRKTTHSGPIPIPGIKDESLETMSSSGIPGDLNGDNNVNNKDAILLFRHLSGWNVEVDNDALDVTGDGKVDQDDGMTLFRYVAGWPNIVLHRGTQGGNSDFKISYYLCSDASSYLVNQEIKNPNPEYYTKSGLTLKNASAEGYIFEGWYDSEGNQAERIKTIPAGTTGEVELYARWTPRTYTVDFDCDWVDVPSKTYTIETGATIPSPKFTNYVFIGWTEWLDNGVKKWVRSIPKGQTRNVVLHANWASKRNIAVPVKKLGVPIILEDEDNGVILFAYELGRIENVPLCTTLQFASAGGVSTTVRHTNEKSISKSNAATIRKSIKNATTNASTWYLAEGWNESTSVSEETLRETGLTREEAEILAKSNTSTYSVGDSHQRAEVTIDENNNAYNSISVDNHTDGEEDENNRNMKLSAKGGMQHGAPLNNFKWELGMEYEQELNKKKTSTDGWSETTEDNEFHSKIENKSDTWTNSNNYSNSNTFSNTTSVSVALTEMISDKHHYGFNYSKNGQHSTSKGVSTESSDEQEFSNTLVFDESEIQIEMVEYQTDGVADGYYRVVQAGTAHVYGVVGYDVAKRSYFHYTCSVMDDDTYAFLDYSKESPSFSDNNRGTLPFEVPFFVDEYVDAKTKRSEGLQVDISSGEVTGYTGDAEIVVIPSYWRVDNGDGTATSVKIRKISPRAFQGNSSIVAVAMGDFITEIPDSAFEGCTSLREIYAPNLTSIGKRAFYDCTSLSKLTVPTNVTSIGEKAFYNVNEVAINAGSKDVATAATQCGAKAITLNISTLDSKLDNTTLTVPSGTNSFELQGERKNFQNLSVESDAQSTTINGVNFKECKRVPLKISSETVNLNQVTADASGFCMILSGSKADISLFGTITLKSASDNTVVLKNATLTQSSPSTDGKINATGNVLLCGSMTGDNLLTFNKGRVVSITAAEFEQYIKGSFTVTLDANGGSVSNGTLTAFAGQSLGELPAPHWDYHDFLGWYTVKTGEDASKKVTADTVFSVPEDTTLYAHWNERPEWSDWSDWSTTPQSASNDLKVETKTEYRYSDKATTTSTSYPMSGWTKYNQTTAWGNWGNWSGWSDTAQSGSDSKDVQTRTEWRYYCFTCPVCGGREPLQGKSDCGKYTLTAANFEIGWFPTAYKDSNSSTYSYATYKRYTTSLGDGKNWCFSSGNLNDTAPGTKDAAGPDAVVIRTAYRYRTRSQITTYYYYKWGDWSNWSETQVTGNDNRKVESRTLYRTQHRLPA